MITAILVMLAVAAMGTSAFVLSSHSLDQSGNDKSRVQSIHAAEAGIDRVFLYLDQTPSNNVVCNPFPSVQTLDSTPQERFQVTLTYYNAAGSPIEPCVDKPAGARSVLIRSVGSVNGATPQRSMESLVRMSTGPAGSFGNEAIFSGDDANVGGGGTVYGDPDNADIYSVGDLTIAGGSTVNGAVRSGGRVTLQGGSQVKRDILATNAVVFSGNNSVVFGTANSALQDITGSGQINGDANACTGIANNTTVLGTKNPTVCPAPPPVRTFQMYTYDPSSWQDEGYTVHTYSGENACSDALTFIRSAPTGNNVVRIEDTCMLSINGIPKEVNVNGHLAILSNGGLTVNAGNYFTSGDGANHKLYLMFGLTQQCPAGDITLNGGTFSNLDTLIYTPCQAKNNGNSALNANGQIYAGNVMFNGGANLTYLGITVPGLNEGSYKQDIAYIREVVN
jgi:hypothetical protein